MKTKALIASLSIAVSAAVAGPAQAAMIAGWDFSQYFGDGVLSLDGETLVDTLPANASNFDPTFGVGAESGNYGTLYLNGQFGSTATPLDIANDLWVPNASGSLVSNINAPGAVPFDQCPVLAAEGQAFCNLAAMTNLGATSVVFEAAPPQFGQDWSMTLAGKTFGLNASVGVEFSLDGTDYVSFGSLNLTSLDTLFTVNFGPGGLSDSAFVRLNFATPSGNDQTRIDNVAINATAVVPEPGTALLLIAGLAGLARFGQRRA